LSRGGSSEAYSAVLRDYGISHTNITEQPLLLTALIDVAALEAIALPVTTTTLYLVLLLFVDGPRRLFITILLCTVIKKAAALTWEQLRAVQQEYSSVHSSVPFLF
jgi:hypothetical protein